MNSGEAIATAVGVRRAYTPDIAQEGWVNGDARLGELLAARNIGVASQDVTRVLEAMREALSPTNSNNIETRVRLAAYMGAVLDSQGLSAVRGEQ